MNAGTTTTPEGMGGAPESEVDQPGTPVDGKVTEATSTSNSDAPGKELSQDIAFKVLQNQRRRYVLQFLNEHKGEVSLSDLSEFIAAKENDSTPAQLSSQERKRAYVGLYQCHLPMMDDAGIIGFNKNRGLIELREQASLLDTYLDKPTAPSISWHAYYLGLAAVSAVLAIACLLVPALPAELVAIAEPAGIGALALVHRWKNHAFESSHPSGPRQEPCP